ncbi:MAG: hypothetical protein ACOY9Y_14590 [Bacillota bacterium]
MLEQPESLPYHSGAGNGGRDGLKKRQDWPISSQAPGPKGWGRFND